MATIREIYDKLQPGDRRALDYAFESGVPHFIKLDGSRYIGVNTQTLKFLKAETQAGKWSIGQRSEGE